MVELYYIYIVKYDLKVNKNSLNHHWYYKEY